MGSGASRSPTNARHVAAGAGRAGVRILVPGWPQWSWRQRGRGMVLLGSYLSAVAVGLFAWGTWASPLLLAFAFSTHVVSTADVVRQRAFPGFGRWAPVVSASAGLSLGYAPLMGSLCMLAWPNERADMPSQGYLTNLWAFRRAAPEVGDWVSYNPPGAASCVIGRVLASSGQEVEWLEGRLRVAGSPLDWVPPAESRARSTILHLTLKVPVDYLLVAPLSPHSDAEAGESLGVVLVETFEIRGRVWAQHAPMWDRRLLP